MAEFASHVTNLKVQREKEAEVIHIRVDIKKDSAFGHAFQLAMAHYLLDDYEPEWESNVVARTILSNRLFSRVDFPTMRLGSQWYPEHKPKTE